METIMDIEPIAIETMFKIYIIVWKLFKKNEYKTLFFKFKIYIIVWKHVPSNLLIVIGLQFKIYIIVWKQKGSSGNDVKVLV